MSLQPGWDRLIEWSPKGLYLNIKAAGCGSFKVGQERRAVEEGCFGMKLLW